MLGVEVRKTDLWIGFEKEKVLEKERLFGLGGEIFYALEHGRILRGVAMVWSSPWLHG
jgi:hypothetical protein